MYILKRSLFLMAMMGVLLISACSEDDDCTPPDVEENIVGEWSVSTTGNVVEFQADGTLIDPEDDLFGVSGDDQKSYVINGDELEVTTEFSGGSSSVTFDIEDNQCDKITISILGSNVDLNRQ